MQAILANVDATNTTIPGDELFLSHEIYGLSAYAAESYDDGASTASYFGIAVVKKEMCEGDSPAFTGFNRASLEVSQKLIDCL
jgi:hypothetical protein